MIQELKRMMYGNINEGFRIIYLNLCQTIELEDKIKRDICPFTSARDGIELLKYQ